MCENERGANFNGKKLFVLFCMQSGCLKIIEVTKPNFLEKNSMGVTIYLGDFGGFLPFPQEQLIRMSLFCI